MIDWWGVFVSALWIMGLALLLATASIAYAFAQGKSLRSVLSQLSFRLALTIGLALFALGMALSVDTWWERGGWALVMGLSAWDGVAAWRTTRVKNQV